MRRRALIAVAASVCAVVVLALVIQASRAGGGYVASSLREPFHRPSCRWAQRIDHANLQQFSTRQAAIDAGHRPCKVCKP